MPLNWLWRGALILLPMAATAQEVWVRLGPPGFAAKATLSASDGDIPAPITLRLELTFPDAYQPNWDEIRSNLLRYDALWQPFHLVSEARAAPHVSEYILEPFLPGTWPLTFLTIPFSAKEPGSGHAAIVSDIFAYKATLPPPSGSLFPYAAPLLPLERSLPLQMSGPFRRQLSEIAEELIAEQATAIQRRTFPWLGMGGLLLLGSACFMIRLLPKSFKRSKTVTPSQGASLARARELLQSLKKESSKEATKAYFSALTEAVRYQMEKAYHLKATAQTSEEFLQTAQEADLKEEDSSQLRTFLHICDAVKFGDNQASIEECTLAYESARRLLRTCPKS